MATKRKARGWRVVVVETATGEPIKTLRYPSERASDKATDALLRQIDVDRFHVETLAPDAD
jgi:hypothetical protein